jgi:hypothetical protein
MVGAHGEQLTFRPYVTTRMQDLVNISIASEHWAKQRRYNAGMGEFPSLRGAVEALRMERNEDDPYAPYLPRSQQHELLQSLYHGKTASDAAWKRISHRYAEGKREFWGALMKKGSDSLFEETQEINKTVEGLVERYSVEIRMRCWLLDALELADLEAQFPQHSN